MTNTFKAVVVALAVALPMASAMATPLTLNYSVNTVNASTFTYSFDLVLDNHDNSWRAGQDFNWFVFGDAQARTSPLQSFAANASSFPSGPFDHAQTTSGFHNGPTLINFPGWTPLALGEKIHWTGTASASLGQGQLLFSNLIGSGVHADFATANLVTAVPEPETYAMMLAGLGMLSLIARRRKKVG